MCLIIYICQDNCKQRISRCEILNNGVITRKKMCYTSKVKREQSNQQAASRYPHLAETLMRMISRCEILNNGVIIK